MWPGIKKCQWHGPELHHQERDRCTTGSLDLTTESNRVHTETIETQAVGEFLILPVKEDIGGSTRSQVARPQRIVRRPVWQEDYVLT